MIYYFLNKGISLTQWLIRALYNPKKGKRKRSFSQVFLQFCKQFNYYQFEVRDQTKF